MNSLSFIAVLVALVLAASATTTSEMHPLEVYVRAASGNLDNELTENDIAKAYAVEIEAADFPIMKKRMRPHLMKFYKEQLNAYPILTENPEQIHISVTEIAGNVSVMWTTSLASNFSQVCYAPEANAAQRVCRNGTRWTYNPISIVPWVGSIHLAHMVDLVAGTRYCYAVGDPTINVFSNSTCFTAPDLKKDSITVAFGGDMGSLQLFGYLVAAQMLADEQEGNIQYDAFWLLGDTAYSTLDPGPTSPNGEFFWDIYLRQEEPFVNHNPFLLTYGNHDFDAGDSGAFINRFRNPQGGKGYDNFYWSYTHGPVKFVSMCTEVALVPTICDYAPGSVQYQWLENEFRSINRTETPWLILGGHRPMYSSDKATDSGPLQEYIEPLLRKYNVDLEISGHMHETELVAPVFNNTPYMNGVQETGWYQWTFNNPEAPVHITAGCMGAGQDERWDSKPWSLFHSGSILDDAYGYVRMEANATQLHFRWFKQSTRQVGWELFMNKN